MARNILGDFSLKIQIKGKKQLPDFTDPVQLISDQFEEYEKYRKVKDVLIKPQT